MTIPLLNNQCKIIKLYISHIKITLSIEDTICYFICDHTNNISLVTRSSKFSMITRAIKTKHFILTGTNTCVFPILLLFNMNFILLYTDDP